MKMSRFIESVRKYPCLWATTSEEYQMEDKKEAAWLNVVKEIGLTTVERAQLLWDILRERYRQTLDKTLQDSRLDVLMAFMLPYMSESGSTSNKELLPDAPNSQLCQNATNSVSEENELKRKRTHESISEDDHERTIIISEQEDTTTECNENERRNETPERELEQGDTRETTNEGNMADGESERRYKRPKISHKPPKNPRKHFFNTMYRLSEDLPERYQMKLQRSIFKMVMMARKESEDNTA